MDIDNSHSQKLNGSFHPAVNFHPYLTDVHDQAQLTDPSLADLQLAIKEASWQLSQLAIVWVYL